MEFFAAVLAALLGVIFDRFGAWHERRRTAQNALELASLKRRAQISQINARIDQEVANETDIGALLDRI